MKRFYSILLSLVVVVSAFAMTNLPGMAQPKMLPSTKLQRSMISLQKIDAPHRHSAQKSAPQSLEDLEGDYIWNYLDLMDGEEVVNTVKFTIDDQSENTIIISSLFAKPFDGQGLSIKATVNLEEGYISIPMTVIEEEGNMALVFSTYNLVLDKKGENIVSIDYSPEVPLMLYYSVDVESDTYHFVSEATYGLGFTLDGKFSEYAYLAYVAIIEAAQPEDPDLIEDPNDYEDVGYAEFTDGWLYTGYGLNDEAPYVVALQKSKVEEEVYRLVNPYSDNGPNVVAQKYNLSTEPGYIKFSIEHPKVPYLFANIYSGFTSSDGLKYYMYDKNGYYVTIENYRPDEHYFSIAFNAATLTTYDEDSATLTIPSPWFGFTGDKFRKAGWYYDDGAPVPAVSVIKLVKNSSGINAVSNECTDAPTTFYDLQGIKVDNPHGGIYIMCQGNKYKKVTR